MLLDKIVYEGFEEQVSAPSFPDKLIPLVSLLSMVLELMVIALAAVKYTPCQRCRLNVFPVTE